MSLGIKKVLQIGEGSDVLDEKKYVDPYAVAKEMGIYSYIPMEGLLNVEEIANRVIKNREVYKKKFEKKIASQ